MPFETVDIKDISGEQVIKIPDKFKIDDDKVYLKKTGNTLYLIPYHNPWQVLFDSLEEFTDDFMDEKGQPAHQKRASLDR